MIAHLYIVSNSRRGLQLENITPPVDLLSDTDTEMGCRDSSHPSMLITREGLADGLEGAGNPKTTTYGHASPLLLAFHSEKDVTQESIISGLECS